MKKGFTLVELIAVIAILGIVLTITVPNVMGILNKSQKNISEEQKLAVENAARAWGLKNLFVEGSNVSSSKVSIKTLKDNHFLENKDFNSLRKANHGNAGVCITYQNNQFVYEFSDDINNCD